MVHHIHVRRFLPLACLALATAGTLAPAALGPAPASWAQTTGGQLAPTQASPSQATTPTLPLPTTTTTPAAPPSSTPSNPATTTTAPAAGKPQPGSTTTAPSKGGVPAVPVGGPPTTTGPTVPGAPPPPPPDPTPILVQVDSDLAQLKAISEYKPAQDLVAKAQGTVTDAGAGLLSARQALNAAKDAQSHASQTKAVANEKLRQMALAAYIGVGYTTPGLGQPAQGNGDQGAGTVSTPGGLTGISAIDAREMLIIVGQHVHQNYDDASRQVADAAKAAQAAAATYQRDQAAVSAAEAQLLSAQQTLKLITTAATTPGAAAATSIPDLLTADHAAPGATPAPTTVPPTTAPAATPTKAANRAGEVPAVAAAIATGPGATPAVKPTSPPILGAPAVDAAQISAWWATLNRQPNITVPIDDLINSYAAWGAKLGVRYDVAFAQSIVETGYFSFPSFGQLTDKDNNFAGIGACDTCAHGWSFPTADTGVQAQLELLRLYATSDPLPDGVKNVIGGTSVGGCCTTWTELAGKWASSTTYGISIMTVYHQMLSWAIPQDEVSAGLIAPTGPAAQGPQLAPLPPGAQNPAATQKGAGAGATPTTTAPPRPVSAAAATKG